MTKKEDLEHHVKFIKVEPGAVINDSHRTGHFLGVVPAKGRRLAAYLVYAVHNGKKAPTKKRHSL